MTDYKHREIIKNVLDALKSMPVVVLSGMRQTGKSTLLVNQPELKKRRYVNFDDYNILEAAQKNPEDILNVRAPLTIDEAQKFPQLLSYIKKEVDRNRKSGRFLLSGSANFLLLKNITESLAGRAIYIPLMPFSRREITGLTKTDPPLIYFIKHGSFPNIEAKLLTYQEILKGGMPVVCLNKVRKPEIWFRGYEQTYLERDLRALNQVADLYSFRAILQLAALRNGSILRQSELARDAKLNAMTTMRYLSLLETSFIIYRLRPYLKNKASRIIKSPKIYISDTGLASHLIGIGNIKNLSHAIRGLLLEGYVLQNIASIISSHSPDSNIFYWNIQGRYEVDFIIESGTETIAIEIKNSSVIDYNDIAGLKVFLESSKNCRGAILGYNGKEIIKLAKKIWAVPISILIS